MYKIILFAYNGSQEGQDALTDTKELALWSGSQVWLVAVNPGFNDFALPDGGVSNYAWDEVDKARYQDILQDGMHKLAQAGFEVQGQVLQGDPVREISKFAAGISADLIVVGHRHLDSSIARWWSGSISSALVEEAPCSVFCVISKKPAA